MFHQLCEPRWDRNLIYVRGNSPVARNKAARACIVPLSDDLSHLTSSYPPPNWYWLLFNALGQKWVWERRGYNNRTESKIFSGCCCTNKMFKDNGTISHGWINFTKKIKKELIIVFQVLSFPSLALSSWNHNFSIRLGSAYIFRSG